MDKKITNVTDKNVTAKETFAEKKPRFVQELEKESKVSVRIKADPKDKEDVPVRINGYVYQIKRGEFVKVPKTVAELLAQAGYI